MVENRLTRPLKKETQGNTKKYDKYREAWTRIKRAQRNSFFLEAITIEESIISDRLSSYLKNKELYPKKSGFISFSDLIKAWKQAYPEPIQIDEIENLREAVDEWRQLRNDAVHAIVKSKSGQSEVSLDEFLENARAAAEKGEIIAKAIQRWTRQVKGH